MTGRVTMPGNNNPKTKSLQHRISSAQKLFARFTWQALKPRETMFSEYLRTAFVNLRKIALFAVCGCLLALLTGLRTLPVYQARTTLDIRSLNSDFLHMRTVPPTADNSYADNDAHSETEIKLLQSDALQRLIAKRLRSEPHPQRVERMDLLSQLARVLHMGNSTLPYQTLIGFAANNMKVKPMEMSRLVEVTCYSYDASFSAKFCNTVALMFEQQDLETRFSETEKTNQLLIQQVADVRGRTEESQRKLAEALGGNGSQLSEATTSAGEDRLRALHEDFVKAKADRIQQEALAGVAGSARAGMQATETSSATRQRNDYDAARHHEDLLQIAYDAQLATVSADRQKAAQVRLLRSELDSEQQVYQKLMQRASETGFASAMQAVTIRVVDAATTPAESVTPRRFFAGVAGLLLGCLCGLVLTFYKGRKGDAVRTPGGIPRTMRPSTRPAHG